MKRVGALFGVLSACLLACLLAACFTEVGNPDQGTEQKVTADFSIDYTANPRVLSKPADGADSVRILQFYLNVVVITFRTVEKQNGTLWSAADSAGIPVDFTQQDSAAVLPPIQVPATLWDQLKFKSRIPDHVALNPDTVDFETFADRGYIKGTVGSGSALIRFLFELPDVYRLNLIYYQDQLDQWRQDDTYHLRFKFFATPWVLQDSLASAATAPDRNGSPVAVIDAEHNTELYQLMVANFYDAFNTLTVQKENP